MSPKLPRSIQVVVFAEAASARQYLLLKRRESLGGFWQSVTGSLEEGETHTQAAVREVREETGLVCAAEDLVDLELINVFEISPLWRHRYAAEITHNEERCFALLSRALDVRLDPAEHTDFAWVEYEDAMAMLYWESNRKALKVTHAKLRCAR